MGERYVEGPRYAILYSYLQALGLNEFNYYEERYSYFLFFGATLLNLIVMLNLLIAIISDTYTRVSANATESSFKEKCDVISDCRDFPLYRLWAKERKPCSFLFIAISEEIDPSSSRRNIDVYDLMDEMIILKEGVTEIHDKVSKIQ